MRFFVLQTCVPHVLRVSKYLNGRVIYNKTLLCTNCIYRLKLTEYCSYCANTVDLHQVYVRAVVLSSFLFRAFCNRFDANFVSESLSFQEYFTLWCEYTNLDRRYFPHMEGNKMGLDILVTL